MHTHTYIHTYRCICVHLLPPVKLNSPEPREGVPEVSEPVVAEVAAHALAKAAAEKAFSCLPSCSREFSCDLGFGGILKGKNRIQSSVCLFLWGGQHLQLTPCTLRLESFGRERRFKKECLSRRRAVLLAYATACSFRGQGGNCPLPSGLHRFSIIITAAVSHRCWGTMPDHTFTKSSTELLFLQPGSMPQWQWH